ncbi:protein of unknown function [Methylorubrum extorquens]|uniref:Transposase IS4-like domain-containing protein n=1 Tax=Methylorubrum extorquens TaxID=408 RepID=A0A2N9ANR2_METEX|nr:protein of unknown function [Methylorubrum extorquens]
MLRRAAGRKAEPSAVIHDSRTLRATPESGERAGEDGAKRKQSSKLHMAVDRLGHLLALHVMPANAPMTVPGSIIWPRPCRQPPTTASRSPSSIRAIPAISRPQPREWRGINTRDFPLHRRA